MLTIQNQTYTIEQFCKVYNISRSKFYLLLNANAAPRIMKVGRRTLISLEAADQWRKKMEGSANA